MESKIKSTIALVTGGASGIGKAVVTRIINNGGRVIILDLNPAGQELAEKLGDRAKFIKADILSENDVKDAIELAKKTFGGLNVVVNSAGIIQLEDIYNFETEKPHSLDVYKKIMDVNVLGTFNVTRLSAGILAANVPDENNQRGVIINISSVSAYDAPTCAIAYAMSKSAVAGMTLPLARAFAPKGIRVVAVAPGLIETPMTAGLLQAVKEFPSSCYSRTSFLSPNRQGIPDEIAHVIQCIIENPFLNAEVIRVDGGFHHIPHSVAE